MFNRELIQQLKETIAKQDAELVLLRRENKKLTERLLTRAGVPPAAEDADTSVKAIERLLASQDIFGEDEIMGDEEIIIDNRKEQNEFAS